MKQITRIVTALAFISMASLGHTQTIDTIFGCDEFPATPAEVQNCSICNFNILYGNTWPYTASPPGDWCGTVENDQYIEFVAGFTRTVGFELQAFNCVNGDGLQVGIYDKTNSLVENCINQVVPQQPQVFTANNLIPGDPYFIRIDGFAGDGCEFFIQVITGIAPAPPPAIDSFLGPLETCLDVDNTFYTDIQTSNSNYEVEFFTGSGIGDVIVSDSSYGGNLGSTQVRIGVIFDGATSSLAPGECDTVGLKVTPINFCVANDTSTYLNVNVCRPISTPDTIYQNQSFPFCLGGYIDTITGRNYPEGIYILPNISANGNVDCDKVVKLTVTSIGTQMSSDITGSRYYCETNGILTVNASGGVRPYTYNWTLNGVNISADSILDNINESGRYVVVVTDAVGCSTRSISANIRSFDEEMANLLIRVDSTDCAGEGGRIFLNANYPSIFDVTWSNGATDTAVINSLVSGNYSLTLVEPTIGCRFDTIIAVPLSDTCYGIISGKVSVDTTIDCTNPTGIPLPNALVSCSNGESVFTNRNGTYRFVVDTGTYTVSIVQGPTANAQPVCDQTISVDVPVIPSQFPNNDFFFESEYSTDIKLVKTNSAPNRGRVNYVALTSINKGLLLENFTVSLEVPINQIFIHADYDGQYDPQTRMFSYDVQDLAPGQSFQNMIYLRTMVTAMLGDTVYYSANIDSTTTSIDFFPPDNSVTCLDTVITAYDPNDKAVSPRGEGIEGFIPNSDTALQYTIRFENTGSADALYVRLEDQLSANLDPSTFQPLAGSDDYRAYFNEDNRLFVEFNDIVLRPVSVDSLNAQGFFSYVIRPYPNLAPGTQIMNTAEIYFDFNDPIITNTTLNTISSVSSIRDVDNKASFVIFPNPTKGDLTVRLQEEQLVKSMHLIGIDGRMLPSLDFDGAGKEYRVNLKGLGLAQGMYTLKLTLASGENIHQVFVLKQ